MQSKLIVEFNGLPGTGKSTICSELYKELNDRGFNVLTHYPSNIIVRHGVSFFAKIGAIKLRRLLGAYCEDFSYEPLNKKFSDGIVRMFYSYILFNLLYKSDRKTILLKEQGIIQGLLSIAYVNKIKNESTIYNLFSFFERSRCVFLRIDCKVNENLSCNRLQLRSKMGSRFDRMQTLELKRNLSVQSDNILTIRKQLSLLEFNNSRSIIIDTERSPQENAKLIISFICSLLNNE